MSANTWYKVRPRTSSYPVGLSEVRTADFIPYEVRPADFITEYLGGFIEGGDYEDDVRQANFILDEIRQIDLICD